MERYTLASLERMFGKGNVHDYTTIPIAGGSVCKWKVDLNKKEGYIMEKELFVEIMNSIKESYEWGEKLNDLVDGGCYFNPLADTLIKTVNRVMGLNTEEYDVISWWCYELGFGKESQESVMVDKKYIDISTPEKFYDYIVEYELNDKE